MLPDSYYIWTNENFDSHFKWEKIDLWDDDSWEEEYWDRDCCDNCSHTTIRPSTGCSWCIIHGSPETGVCEWYNKKYKTTYVIEKLAHRHFCNWEDRNLNDYLLKTGEIK